MWLRGGQCGCCSGLSDTVWHSGIVKCRSTCAAGNWTACRARVWLFGSVTMAVPGERMVGSEECVPAGSEGCDTNGGN